MGVFFKYGASVGVGSPKGSLPVMKLAQISESTYMYIFTFNLSLDRSFLVGLCDGFKIVSGGRREGSKRDLKFQRATWHNLIGWEVSSRNVRFCRLNICTKRPQSGVWMN